MKSAQLMRLSGIFAGVVGFWGVVAGSSFNNITKEGLEESAEDCFAEFATAGFRIPDEDGNLHVVVFKANLDECVAERTAHYQQIGEDGDRLIKYGAPAAAGGVLLFALGAALKKKEDPPAGLEPRGPKPG